MQKKIPRCMSTQHPDNVNLPFFAENSELSGEDEIQEAYYAFSHLGIDEQMWDCEGKEVDNYVVGKLLSRYGSFFRENIIGKDIFLTLRVPNPDIERTEAKILVETLESIPRSFDVAKLFYNDDIAPIFEVILPMTTSSRCINRVYHYYKNFVVGKQNKKFSKDDVKIKEWIGEFKPKEINVIPLFETKEAMLNAHIITKEYLKDKKEEYQRVFLARSDPAMNYGALSAVLLNKIALQNLWELEEKISVEILPIIGVGSAPFRGNLKPENVDSLINAHPSVQTLTIQSAFKYDNSEKEARDSIEKIKNSKRKEPIFVDKKFCLEIIEKFSVEYGKQIRILSNLINRISKYIPSRRKRKLHIGLFGYSRSVRGITLPRAIPFCCALYSIGLPPEILGLNTLNEKEIYQIKEIYKNFENDLKSAMPYFNKNVIKILPRSLTKKLRTDIVKFETDEKHLMLTNQIIDCLRRENFSNLQELIIEAAKIRKFLG
ncbi:MAG: phosphoenolpyruvate carboxylase [Candidatus Altiarchaeota archaeon]